MFEFYKPFKDGTISLKCIQLGEDYQIIISGGAEHIGATALAVCYDKKMSKVNVSQLAVYGHKEDELVRKVALYVSKELRATVSVTAGIHFDNLSVIEIDEILSIVDLMVLELMEEI